MAVTRPRPAPPAPVALFSPAAGEAPPAAAVELYFEAPTSVGILYAYAFDGGRDDVVDAIEAAREAAMADVLQCLYEHALLKVGQHTRQRRSQVTVGEYQPGELQVTRVAHVWATDRAGVGHGDVARIHDHVYLGATGYLPRDGRRWPVDLHSSRRSCTQMWPRYKFQFETALTARLGVTWGPRGGGQSPASELIDPALAQYVLDFPRCICRDGYQVAERWNVQDIAHPPRLEPDAS